MRPRLWGVIVFMLTVAVAATPASGGEPYIATASATGDAVYMAPGQGGIFSEPKNLQRMSDNALDGLGSSQANGIGDFDGDGALDYVVVVGSAFLNHVIVFPKMTDPETGEDNLGNQFGTPVRLAPFSEGYSPTAMTVADFDGDTYLDFVVVTAYTYNCVLFLNKGAGKKGVFEFEPFILENASIPVSYGIDAADFNNDGKPDFIVASPTSYFPFQLNINQGNIDGVPVFESRPFSPPAGKNIGYYGIAAADFIETYDVDGEPELIADLAISNAGSLDIYRGDGTGSFTFIDSYSLPLSSSPLDNGDFDRDGKQDLIAGNFNNNPSNLVVLFGRGDGDFRFSGPNDIYTLPGLMAPTAVTALPFVFNSNKAPVAQLIPAEPITVTVGETVHFDASASSDDGTIVCYEWDYGDGVVRQDCPGAPSVSAASYSEVGPPNTHVYYDSGPYTVTLTVTDDQGATGTVQVEVNVEALGVSVYFSPSRLNLNSKGRWITATIRVPAGYDARGINADNLYLVVSDDTPPIPAHKVYPHKGYRKHHKKKYRRIRTLKAKFDRQALIDALATGKATLTVTGEIATSKASLEFAGKCNIEAYEKQNKKSFRSYLWKQILTFFSKGKSK